MSAATAPTPKPCHPPMSATATLTNCYVPLPASSPSIASSRSFDPFARPADDDDGDDNTMGVHPSSSSSSAAGGTAAERRRGRGPRTLRRIRLERSVLHQSTGSSLVEWGHTKLMVSVRGPRPANCSSMGGGGGLVCEVRYMPHVGVRAETLARHSLSHDFSSSGVGGGATAAPRVPRDSLGTSQDSSALSSGASPCSPAAFADETHLSRRLMEALSPAVVAPSDGGKTVVEVFVYVLQGDGCVFDAAVVGASLALADAGVPMRDAVTAGTAAVMRLDDNGGAATMTTATAARGAAVVPRYAVIADPTEDEVLRACGVVTIALMPNWREVTAWDQFGRMPPGAAAEATELARCGCATMHKFLRNCLLTTTTRNDGGGER